MSRAYEEDTTESKNENRRKESSCYVLETKVEKMEKKLKKNDDSSSNSGSGDSSSGSSGSGRKDEMKYSERLC